MLSPSHGESIEDVMESLQLHHVLLHSLEEEQPNATSEKEEIFDDIRRLERKLAKLRRDRFRNMFGRIQPSVNASASASDAGSPLAQLDGTFDDSADPSGTSRFTELGPSSTATAMPAPSHPPRHSTRSALRGLPPARTQSSKRSYGHADLMGDLGPLPKRSVTSYPHRSAPSSPSVESTHCQYGSSPSEISEDFEGADDLRELLGFDGRDTFRELQDEQRRAEQWLEDRKAQERRDEEYARMLQEGLHEPPPPPPPQQQQQRESISNPASLGDANFSTASLPPAPAIQGRIQRHPLPSSSQPLRSLPSYSGEPSRSAFGQPVSAMTGRMLQYPPPLTSYDDDDFMEISALDFQSSSQRPSDFKQTLSNRNFLYPSAYPWTSAEASGSWHTPDLVQGAMDMSKNILPKPKYTHLDGFPGPLPFLHAFEQYEELNPYRTEYANEFDEFGGDPKKAREEIKQLLETIRPDLEVSARSREGTPEALKYPLMEHQKVGLTWMKSMEESDQKGGILADDMGLGKTIQALALIVSRPSPDPARKTTLIIAPVSLMHQWKREIQMMLKPNRHQRSVFVLHGERRGVSFKDLKSYDVVLTTFGTMASELKRKEQWDELEKKNLSNEDIAKNISLPVLGPRSMWYRVIIDEAQCIKNRNTKAALSCCRIDAIHRWCMSGTPMMNNVTELHSLLKFLRIRPYSSLEKFNNDFARPLKNGGREQEKAMTQLQILLKAVLLRRTKTSTIDGKPILQLPPRISEKVHAVFSEDERQLYDALENKTQLQFNKYLRAGTVGRNYSQVLVLLLRLRQACCHPHLMNDFGVKANAETQDLNLTENAKKFSPQVVARLKENDSLECPICIDAVENPIIFFPCGHNACTECFSRMTDPAAGVMQGYEGTVEVKCPNCRAKIDPKKVTDHTCFKKVHFPDTLEDAIENDEGPRAPDDEADEDEDNDDSDDDSDGNCSLSRFVVDDEDNGMGSSKAKKKNKGKKVDKPKKSLAELKKEAYRNVASRRKYFRRLEKTWVSSAKVDKAIEILEDVENRATGEKTIIFSQFTSLLDLLEVPIMRRGWGYRRYDGGMRAGDRNSAVIEFTDNPNCKIMLVSLKAGNSGLNLVAASQVIIFDPFWNPYIEEQAIDRAHRIGQVREVNIHRILVEKTVEDRILELQDKKREVIEGALDENARQNISRLGTRELAYLFGVN